MTENSELEAAIAAVDRPWDVKDYETRVDVETKNVEIAYTSISDRDFATIVVEKEIVQASALAAFAAYREQVARLQADNSRLRAALRPFAEASLSMHAYDGQLYQGVSDHLPIKQGIVDEAIMDGYGVGEITVGDLQQATAALADENPHEP